MREVLVEVLGESYEAQMELITRPVKLLWGSEDTEVPVDIAERAVGVFPRATLTVLPGVGHLVPVEAPEAMSQALRELLE